METSIVWAVVWGALALVAPGLIILITTILSGAVGTLVARDDPEGGVIVGGFAGQIIGWVLAVGFFILAVVQCVLMIINAVKGV